MTSSKKGFRPTGPSKEEEGNIGHTHVILVGTWILEEEEIDNFEYEFNEIVINRLADLDPKYVIDMETIKEILLLEQKGNLARGFANLLRSKRNRHPEAYAAYRAALRF
jgi:hypothetical protein